MKKNKKIIWVSSIIVPSLFAIFFLSFNNLNQNQINSSVNQISLNSSNKAISRMSKYVNYLTPGSPDSAFTDSSGKFDPKLKSQVINIYSKKPSQVTQQDVDKLFVLSDDITQVGFVNSPKFTNLNLQPLPSLPLNTPLSVFNTTSGNNYNTLNLDELGILTFRLVLTEPTGTGMSRIHYEYFILSGFNSQTISTTLPGSFYQYTVNQLSTSQLESFINFTTGSVSPSSILLKPNSRINNDEKGSIKFELDLTYSLPSNLNFDTAEVGKRFPSDNISDTNKPFFKVTTSYGVPLEYTGFQIGNALTNEQIYILLSIIAGVIFVIIGLICLFVLIYKKIKAMTS